MNDLISRNEAREIIADMRGLCRNDVLCDAMAKINALPSMSAVQEPVKPVVDKNISTGENDDPWGRLFFCGACGKRINEKYNPDEYDEYCKHCGRKVKW